MIIDVVVKLLLQHLDAISASPEFESVLEQVFVIFDTTLDLQTLSISSAIYAASSSILATLGSSERFRDSLAKAALDLWKSSHPSDLPLRQAIKDGHVDEVSNQEALASHADVFLKAHELVPVKFERNLDSDMTMRSIEKTIFGCVHPQYTTDVNKIAPEQEKVLAMLPILLHTMKDRRSEYLRFLESLVRAVLLDDSAEKRKLFQHSVKYSKLQQPTFVAFSYKVIGVLPLVIKDSDKRLPVHADMLNTLSDIIRSNYTSTPQGTNSPLWQISTSAAIHLIELILGDVERDISPGTPPDIRLHQAAFVGVAASILQPGGLESLSKTPPDSQILADEAFDIDSFTRLNKIILPTLVLTPPRNQPTPSIPTAYAHLLFQTSLLFPPHNHLDDLPPPSVLLTSPLAGLMAIRPGTVLPPTIPKRLRIPYVALDTLFSLVSWAHGETASPPSASRLAMAKACAPYLLLRVAHTLKAFIADQPLRSLTPPPWQAQVELRTLISLALSTHVLDAAFADLTGVPPAAIGGALRPATGASDGLTHLRVLYPHVLRVTEVWRRIPRLKQPGGWLDGENAKEIENGLETWVRIVGQAWEFGGGDGGSGKGGEGTG